MTEKQRYSVGDIALLSSAPGNLPFKVKVLECNQDEDGLWWYEVTPTDWTPIGICNREVPQYALSGYAEGDSYR